MKRSLMVFASISAFVLPALAPVAALAQDTPQAERPEHARGDRARPSRSPDDGGDDQSQRGNRDGGGDRSDRTPPAREGAARQDHGDRSGGRGYPRSDRPQPQTPPTPQTQPDGSSGNDGQGRGNRPDRGGADDDGRNGGRNGNTGWNDANQGRPGQGRPDRDHPGQGRPGQDRPGQDRPGGDRPDRPGNGNGGWNGGNGNGRPDRPNDGRPGNNNGGWNGNGQNRPGNDWNNGDRGRDRDRQRNDYRNRFDSGRWQQNWNRSHRSDWWRNDNRFRGWSGVRFGFYFAPGYGYYSVPRSYYGRTYQVGEYLPSIFWRYSVNDYRTYGLGYPPEGTRWVYVDNAIYLIDGYDGYIIDVIRDAWRW